MRLVVVRRRELASVFISTTMAMAMAMAMAIHVGVGLSMGIGRADGMETIAPRTMRRGGDQRAHDRQNQPQ